MTDSMISPSSPANPVRPFADPVRDSAVLFRHLLHAMAKPGTPVTTAFSCGVPDGMDGNAFAIALTLFDTDTRVYLSPSLATGSARENIRFHCNAPITAEPEDADFAVLTLAEAGHLLPRLKTGTPDYPDRAATAIIICGNLPERVSASLTGPGIAETAGLTLDADQDTWTALTRNHARYPLGFDSYFVFQSAIIGLPRSTHVAPVAPADRQGS